MVSSLLLNRDALVERLFTKCESLYVVCIYFGYGKSSRKMENVT
jgi:hypothetical protein